jgi:hypothetical protein
MSKPKLIINGAGGHARPCINLIEKLNNFDIATIRISDKDKIITPHMIRVVSS